VLNGVAKPAFDRADVAIEALIELNAAHVGELGRMIEQRRTASRFWGTLLDLASAIFAIIAAFLVIRLVRRFAAVMRTRVMDLEQFAGRVAHDIRSPLTSVALALEVTRRDSNVDPKTRAMLGRGIGTMQRVGQIVDGLLVFARAGATPEEGAKADVLEICEGVLEDFRPAAEEKEIDLACDSCEAQRAMHEQRPLTVACSPGVFTSLLSNLVGNAIKYMGNAPVRRVRVRLRSAGEKTRVEVEDTGPGVPRELWDRIFDPFVRAADSTAPGLGLGLSTARRLAEAHGGAVGVASPVGAGSVFWFELPNVPAELRAQEAPRRKRWRVVSRPWRKPTGRRPPAQR
jgi:signal transduction histidine kinase